MPEPNIDTRLEALIEAYRFGEVGRCVNSVTHDANNALGVILAYAELIALEPNIEGEAQRMLAEIVLASRRASDQLSWLTQVARPAPAKLESANVATIVDRVIALRHYEAKHHGIELKVHVPDDLPEVSVDFPVIERVLIYLLANAVDAVAETDDQCVWIDGASANGVVTIHVRDSADSVSDVDRIFEPFFTTKGGNHIGIGLHAARLAAESNGGTLTYEAGRGFCLSLPVG
jgi:C4-dicarboxylate-specific signal transduction histidine kinase